ncbi:hypothetical protein HDU96_006557 [Phlyctochytrium bullatum]|nr:hypothetical protein HDU96_006557 [Phlyctochytrium bullatum]
MACRTAVTINDNEDHGLMRATDHSIDLDQRNSSIGIKERDIPNDRDTRSHDITDSHSQHQQQQQPSSPHHSSQHDTSSEDISVSSTSHQTASLNSDAGEDPSSPQDSPVANLEHRASISSTASSSSSVSPRKAPSSPADSAVDVLVKRPSEICLPSSALRVVSFGLPTTCSSPVELVPPSKETTDDPSAAAPSSRPLPLVRSSRNPFGLRAPSWLSAAFTSFLSGTFFADALRSIVLMPWLFHSRVGDRSSSTSADDAGSASPKPFFPLRSSITGYHSPRPSVGAHLHHHLQHLHHRDSVAAQQLDREANQDSRRSSSPAPPSYLVPRASLTLPPAVSPGTTASVLSGGDSPVVAGFRKKDILALKNELGPKLIIVMVGLPARGKSYLAWVGFNTKVFNVGNRRRVMGTGDEKDGPASAAPTDDADTRPPQAPSPTPRHPLEAPSLVLPAAIVPPAIHPSPDASPAMSGSFMMSPMPSESAPSPQDPPQNPQYLGVAPRRGGVHGTSGMSPLSVDITPRSPSSEGGAVTEEEEGTTAGGEERADAAGMPSFATADAGVVSPPGAAGADAQMRHSPVVVSAPGTTHDANFFDPKNANAKAIREKLAMDTLDEAIEWLKVGGGKVAIHDATNSTEVRRRAILERVRKEKNMQAVFVESICTDDKLLESNILMKLRGPDYINMPRDEAIADFKARMHNYEKAYETISEREEEAGVSYIKLINVGKKVIAHNIHGYIPSQCVFYLMQMHIKKRVIWLTRHGESMYNAYNRIGGDPPLTDLGHRYAAAMARFIQQFHPPPSDEPLNSNSSLTPPCDDFGGGGDRGIPPEGTAIGPDDVPGTLPTDSSPVAGTPGPNGKGRPLAIWTSTLERTVQSVEGFRSAPYEIKHMRNLNEIYAGMCENMTYEEIEAQYPQVWAERQSNKLLFRYPGAGGESYSDVIERLRPVIVELERMESDMLIVSHQVVMRTLLAYFCGMPLQDMTTLSVPLHTLYRLSPTPYGADLVKYEWNPITDDFDVVGTSL